MTNTKPPVKLVVKTLVDLKGAAFYETKEVRDLNAKLWNWRFIELLRVG